MPLSVSSLLVLPKPGLPDRNKLWDDIALTDDEGVVVDALRIIDPHVSKVTMVGGDSIRGRRTAIVRPIKSHIRFLFARSATA